MKNAIAENEEENCHPEQPVLSSQHFGRTSSNMHGTFWNGLPGKTGLFFWEGKFEPFLLNIERNITIRSHPYYKLNLILLRWFPDEWIHIGSSKCKYRMVFENLILQLLVLLSETAEFLLPSSFAYRANEWHKSPSEKLSTVQDGAYIP